MTIIMEFFLSIVFNQGTCAQMRFDFSKLMKVKIYINQVHACILHKFVYVPKTQFQVVIYPSDRSESYNNGHKTLSSMSTEFFPGKHFGIKTQAHTGYIVINIFNIKVNASLFSPHFKTLYTCINPTGSLISTN